MLLSILSTLHNITTLLFGILISAFLLGVKQNRKNVLVLLLFSSGEGVLYLISALLFGEAFSLQIYPLIYPVIIHFPLIIFLNRYYHYSLLSCGTSVCSAYMCCQISNWIGLLFLSITNLEWCYYSARILTTILTFFLLCRFVCRTSAAIFAKGKRALCTIAFLPFVYYVFDYIATKFSNLLYSGNRAIVEFMGFAFCIAYLIFLFVYFKEYELAQEVQQYNALMEMQLSAIQKQVDYVKNSKQTLSILRHDMRHHLSFIQMLLQTNESDKVSDYIKQITDAYDDTIVTTYCKNEMLNAVLSIYQTRFASQGITLNLNISCESIPFSELAFCAILSNALENAIHALEKVAVEKKYAILTISNRENTLMLRLENPISHIPKFVDGIPVSGKEGHGIGVRSIIYYVEQLKGQWHFSISDGSFVLRVII